MLNEAEFKLMIITWGSADVSLPTFPTPAQLPFLPSRWHTRVPTYLPNHKALHVFYYTTVSIKTIPSLSAPGAVLWGQNVEGTGGRKEKEHEDKEID